MAINNLNGLYQFVDRINTSLYKDFIINKKVINDPNIYNLECEMRDTCIEIHRKQFKHLRKLFINLCIESHDWYYFNILRMITLCYNFFVEHEIYAMAYNKKINHLYDHLFIKNTLSKWCDDEFLEVTIITLKIIIFL